MNGSSQSSVLKNANTLRQTTTQKKQIDAALKETLLHINDLILQAHEDGKGHVQVGLPMQFPIEGMSFSKMQSIIWCKIIEALEANNYVVAIEPTKTECVLYIEWEIDEEKMESEKQMRILANHTTKLHK
jgi:hypothetical protein